MNKFWILLKSTFKEIAKNKAIYYTMGFGVILLTFGFTQEGILLEFQKNGESKDLSSILSLIFFHIFLYIWLLVIVNISSNDFFEESEDGSAEVILPYMSKKSYFLSKFVGDTVSSFLFLLLTFLIVFIILKFTIKAPSFKLILSLFMLVPNFLFLFSLLLIFMAFSLRKTAAILSYISYLFFSILNIDYVLSKFFGEGLKNVLKYIIPSIGKWQNEIAKFGVGFEISGCWKYWFFNVIIYSLIILILAMKFSGKYEV
ncbi:MAG: hypothetical protein ACE5WD_10225 [Candidatus Aminicenantia bacterium]